MVIRSSVVFVLPYGVFGAMYMCVAPESTIPILSGGKKFSGLFDTYDLEVGLQLKLASYIKLSLFGLLSTTVLAGPTCHSSLNTFPLASISFVAQPILSLFCVGQSNTCCCGEEPIVPPLHNA